MTVPQKMLQTKMRAVVDMRRSRAKVLFVMFMVLCMTVGNMAAGYNAAEFVRLIKQCDEHEEEELMNSGITVMASLLVALTGILGARFLFYKDPKKLNVYAWFAFLALCLQVFCALNKASDLIKPASDLKESFCKNVTELGLAEQRRIWDGIETTQACCGLKSPDDYLAMNKSIPVSCCPEAYAQSNELARTSMYNDCIQFAAYNKKGCIVKVLEMQSFEMLILLFWAGTSIGIQFCGIILAIWIARRPPVILQEVNKNSAAL